jgi:hypothetical protein
MVANESTGSTACATRGGRRERYVCACSDSEIFFLIDRAGAHLFGGPHFHFMPYDYGPFDSAVYEVLDLLSTQDYVQIDSGGRYRHYCLTPCGFNKGQRILDALPVGTQKFLRDTANWVRALRFDQLVAAIYREYPDMKVNSIFNQ